MKTFFSIICVVYLITMDLNYVSPVHKELGKDPTKPVKFNPVQEKEQVGQTDSKKPLAAKIVITHCYICETDFTGDCAQSDVKNSMSTTQCQNTASFCFKTVDYFYTGGYVKRYCGGDDELQACRVHGNCKLCSSNGCNGDDSNLQAPEINYVSPVQKGLGKDPGQPGKLHPVEGKKQVEQKVQEKGQVGQTVQEKREVGQTVQENGQVGQTVQEKGQVGQKVQEKGQVGQTDSKEPLAAKIVITDCYVCESEATGDCAKSDVKNRMTTTPCQNTASFCFKTVSNLYTSGYVKRYCGGDDELQACRVHENCKLCSSNGCNGDDSNLKDTKNSNKSSPASSEIKPVNKSSFSCYVCDSDTDIHCADLNIDPKNMELVQCDASYDRCFKSVDDDGSVKRYCGGREEQSSCLGLPDTKCKYCLESGCNGIEARLYNPTDHKDL